MELSKIQPHPSTAKCFSYLARKVFGPAANYQPGRSQSQEHSPKHLEYEKWHIRDYLVSFPSD